MHVAVFAGFCIMRLVVELCFWSVLDDEHTARFKPAIGKHQLVNVRDIAEFVRRVRKNQIHCQKGFFKVFEDVGAFRAHHAQLQLFGGVADKLNTSRMFIDGVHPGCTARGKFQADIAGSGKQVEYRQVFKIQPVV